MRGRCLVLAVPLDKVLNPTCLGDGGHKLTICGLLGQRFWWSRSVLVYWLLIASMTRKRILNPLLFDGD